MNISNPALILARGDIHDYPNIPATLDAGSDRAREVLCNWRFDPSGAAPTGVVDGLAGARLGILRNMVRVELDGPVVRMVLDRPDVRNALNDELIDRLAEEFSNLRNSVRVVVVTGEGKAFCAGGDLQWMRAAADYSEEENFRDALRLARLFQAVAESRAVVIARVNGAAFGGGCGLVAAADIAIASRSALFSFSEVKLGLVPATISPFVLAKIGPGHARALFTTGESFGPERAFQIGLVHEVVDPEALESAVDRKISALLTVGPRAATACKLIAQSQPLGLDEAARLLARTRAGSEAREGVAAFLGKRTAAFVVERDHGRTDCAQ